MLDVGREEWQRTGIQSGKCMSFRLVLMKKKNLCCGFRGALMCDTVLAKGEIFLKENAFCHTRMTLNCADHCKRNDETLTPFPS